MQPIGRNRHRPKIVGSAPFLVRGLGLIEHSPWAEAYLHTKWHLDAFSRFATIEMGRKLVRVFAAPLGPHLTQSRLG